MVGYLGPYTHSPVSKWNKTEKAPQLLAVSDEFIFANLGFPDGVTKFEFYDWPERVAIDSLTITTVPEPGTLLLLGAGLTGIVLTRKKRKAHAGEEARHRGTSSLQW